MIPIETENGVIHIDDASVYERDVLKWPVLRCGNKPKRVRDRPDAAITCLECLSFRPRPGRFTLGAR